MSDRLLSVRFESAEAFQKEYASNLASGGVFLVTDEAIALRERVRVKIDLPFCRRHVEIPGEVVHRIPPEMALAGASAGVAVQFEGSAASVRGLLEPLREAAGAPESRRADSGRRRSPRAAARVPARIGGSAGEVSGHTRNLSQTGVLVSVPGKGMPVGERVKLSLTDPERGDTMRVDGVVVRLVEADGGVAAMAVEFAPSEADRDSVMNFVDGIQSSEHARRLGGIAGDIAELGVQNLLQMFGSTGSPGTLTVRDGDREGLIGFDRGILRFVRLGPVSGLKALVRLLSWQSGHFEFHARLDPLESSEPPLPLEAALLESLRLMDESRAAGAPSLPDTARPRLLDPKAADSAELCKTEAAVLDLVRVGFDVGRMVAVIPEPDPEIRRALARLCERGIIAV